MMGCSYSFNSFSLFKNKLAVISPNGADSGGFRLDAAMLPQNSPCADSGSSGPGSTRQQGYSSEMHSGLPLKPHRLVETLMAPQPCP